MKRQAQNWENIFFNACYQQRISNQNVEGSKEGKEGGREGEREKERRGEDRRGEERRGDTPTNQ